MTAVCFSYHLMAKNDVWISEEIAEEWKQTLDLWTRQRRNWEGLIELHWVDKIHLYLWNNNNNNMFLYSIPLQTSTATLWIEDWTKPNIFTLYHGNTPITITLLVDCWRSHFFFPITPGIPFFQKHNQMTWVRLQFYWNNVWRMHVQSCILKWLASDSMDSVRSENQTYLTLMLHAMAST